MFNRRENISYSQFGNSTMENLNYTLKPQQDQKNLNALEKNLGQRQADNQNKQQINLLKQSLQQAQNEYEMLIKKNSELEKDIERQELEFNKVVVERNDLLKALRNEVEVERAQRKQNNIQYFTEIQRLLKENKQSQAKLKIMQQQQDYLFFQQQKQTEEFVKYADRTIQKYKNEIDELQLTIQAIYKKEIEKLLDAELFDQSQMEKIKKYQQKCHSNSLDQIYQQYIISLENLENEKQASRKIIYDQFNPIHVYQEKIQKLKQLIQICKNILIDYFNQIDQIEQHQLQQEQNQQNQKIQQKQTIIIKLKSEIKLAHSNFEKLEKSFNENKQKLQEAQEYEKKLFKLFQQQKDIYNLKIKEIKKPIVGRINLALEN